MKNKQNWLWIAGLLTTLVTAVTAWAAERPKEPLVITIQQQSSSAETIASEAEKAETAEISRLPEQSAETAATVQETEQTHTTHQTTTLEQTIIQNETPDRNLNSADAAALKCVSGVGDVLADAIIAYRDAHGGFRRRDELLEIDGIGQVLQQRIMAYFEIPDELPPETVLPDPEPQAEPEIVNDTPEMTETRVESAQTTWTQETTSAEYYYNINSVTKTELLRIPDMTEKLADEILHLREQLGAYHNIYELGLIDGLNGVYFETVLREYLYCEPEP